MTRILPGQQTSLQCALVNRDNPAKHLIIPLLAAITIYVIAYGGIEHLRKRKGPWQVTFTRFFADAEQTRGGSPTLVINQPALHITNVQIVFTNELPFTNPPTHLTFGQPRPVPYDLPFGKCIFMDSTFLPGTLTIQMFGHELELLPRTLIVDHQEHVWGSGEVIQLGEIR